MWFQIAAFAFLAAKYASARKKAATPNSVATATGLPGIVKKPPTPKPVDPGILGLMGRPEGYTPPIRNPDTVPGAWPGLGVVDTPEVSGSFEPPSQQVSIVLNNPTPQQITSAGLALINGFPANPILSPVTVTVINSAGVATSIDPGQVQIAPGITIPIDSNAGAITASNPWAIGVGTKLGGGGVGQPTESTVGATALSYISGAE